MLPNSVSKVLFQSVAWLLITAQLVPAETLTDAKTLQKVSSATLAPQYISAKDPLDKKAADSVQSVMNAEAVLWYIGSLHFENRPRSIAELKKLAGDQFRNYGADPFGLSIRSMRLAGKTICLDYINPLTETKYTAEVYPKDHGDFEKFGIALVPQNADADIPLHPVYPKGSIGHGIDTFYRLFKDKPVTVTEFMAERVREPFVRAQEKPATFSETTARKELKALVDLGLIDVNDTSQPYTYTLNKEVREAHRTTLSHILAIKELDLSETPKNAAEVSAEIWAILGSFGLYGNFDDNKFLSNLEQAHDPAAAKALVVLYGELRGDNIQLGQDSYSVKRFCDIVRLRAQENRLAADRETIGAVTAVLKKFLRGITTRDDEVRTLGGMPGKKFPDDTLGTVNAVIDTALILLARSDIPEADRSAVYENIIEIVLPRYVVISEDNSAVFGIDVRNGEINGLYAFPSKFMVWHDHETAPLTGTQNAKFLDDTMLHCTISGALDSTQGFLRLDPPVKKPAKPRMFMDAARLLGNVINNDKRLVLGDSVKAGFREELGIVMPGDLTLGAFLKITADKAIVRKLKIDASGIHPMTAGKMAEAAGYSPQNVVEIKKGHEVASGADSIAIMGLCIDPGDVVDVFVYGNGASSLFDALADILKDKAVAVGQQVPASDVGPAAGNNIAVSFKDVEEITRDREIMKALRPVIARAASSIARWKSQHRLGYRALPDQTADSIDRINQFARKRVKAGVQDVIVLGMGGQYMTNRALQDSLAPALYNYFPELRKGHPRVHLLGNVDPTAIRAFLKENNLNPETTDICFNSKSGNTVESLLNGYFLMDWLVNALGEEKALKHTVILTNDNQPVTGRLGEFFRDKKVQRFYIPTAGEDVGGRFSILAPSSLVSAAYAGINIRKILRGASVMKKSLPDLDPDNITPQDIEKNIALKMAMYAYYNARSNKDHFVIATFSEKLRTLSELLKQLFGESDAKDHKGIFPLIATGVDSVNAFIDSPKNKLFFFLNYIPEGVNVPRVIEHPYISVDMRSVDEETFGQLMYLCEDFTVWLGALLEIDPLVQPKVALAKEITEARLSDSTFMRMLNTLPVDSITLEGENPLEDIGVVHKAELDGLLARKTSAASVKRTLSKAASARVKDFLRDKELLAKEMMSPAVGINDFIVVGDRASLLKMRAIHQSSSSLMHNSSNSERVRLPRIHFIDETKKESIKELFRYCNPTRTMVQFMNCYRSDATINQIAAFARKQVADADKMILFADEDVDSGIGAALAAGGIAPYEILPCFMFGYESADIEQFMGGYRNYPQEIARKIAAYSYLMYSRPATGSAKTINIINTYNNRLGYFNSWVKSRFRDKLKAIRYGPAFDASIGSTDQHSVLEGMLNWKNSIFSIFITFDEDVNDITAGNRPSYAVDLIPPYARGKTLQQILRAMQSGVSEALTNDSRPNVTVRVPRLDAENLGSLFALFENASSFEAEFLAQDVKVKPASSARAPLRIAGKQEAPAPAAVVGEQLIGKGFKADELEKAAIEKSAQFNVVADELERKLKEAEAIKPELIHIWRRVAEDLRAFRAGENGKRIGITASRYVNDNRYYLGFGTGTSVALGGEFVDPRNPLSGCAQEALFHELFHAGRAQPGTGTCDHGGAHYEAIRCAAYLFWKDMSYAQAFALGWPELNKYSENILGDGIRRWRDKKEEAYGAISTGDWKYIRNAFRGCLTEYARQNDLPLVDLIDACSTVTGCDPRYPVEGRYPILKAVSLLGREEKDALVAFLYEHDNLRQKTISDSIILMLKDDVDGDWISRQAPFLKGRRVYQVSSEIWNPAGGLGRVMQFHGIGMHKFLSGENIPLIHIEPFYGIREKGPDGRYKDSAAYEDKMGVYEDKEENRVTLFDRFTLQLGTRKANAVIYRARNRYGIETYLIKGYIEGQDEEMLMPFYTGEIYKWGDGQSRATIQEFSLFMSLASNTLADRLESNIRSKEGGAWKAPVIHFNDGQLGYAPYFIKEGYALSKDRNDYTPEIWEAFRVAGFDGYRFDNLKAGIVAFSTHTYPNRVSWDRTTGGQILDTLGIPKRHYGEYFVRQNEPVIDQTSAGIRASDWTGGVSAKHVNDIMKSGYDHGGVWKNRIDLIAVTNGDDRVTSSKVFRKALKDRNGESFDTEELTPEQVRQAKKDAKEVFNRWVSAGKRLGQFRTALGDDAFDPTIDPELPVVSYSGRGVCEKINIFRAWNASHIISLVNMGYQVVLGIGSQREWQVEQELKNAYNFLKASHAPGAGKLVILFNFDIEDQRHILAASDFQVQDSDPGTEAAGYSEADVSANGGLQVAPPWREGILQANGIPFNLQVPGEGNVFTPAIQVNESEYYPDLKKKYDYNLPRNAEIGRAYLKIFSDLMQLESVRSDPRKLLDFLAPYQANSVRISRVLETRLTSAEYLRQWSMAISRKEIAPAPKDLRGKNSPATNPVLRDLIAAGKVIEVSLEQGALKAHEVEYVDGYRPGITEPNKYRGPPIEDIGSIFTANEQSALEEWLASHPVEGPRSRNFPEPARIRVIRGEAAIGWRDDADHSNISHAGQGDGVIYIGELLLKHILKPENASLHEEILDKDEYQHLLGKSHGTDAEEAARIKAVDPVIRDIQSRVSSQADLNALLGHIANLPIIKDRLTGTREAKISEIRKYILNTNENGFYYSKGESGISVKLSGKLGKILGLNDDEIPLYYTITSSREGDFGSEGLLKEATDLARDMFFKNLISDVFFDGGKSCLRVDGKNYIAVTAVYGDEELFERGQVIAKGGVRITCAQNDGTPENIANVRRAIERYIKAFVDLETLGVSRVEGPDMRPLYMDVGDIMELIDSLGEQAAKDLDRELLPFTTSGSEDKGFFSHDSWRVTSLSVLESICAILDDEDALKRFNVSRDEARSITLQGFGEVGSNIVRLLYEDRLKPPGKQKYARYNFRIVGVSDLACGSIYNKDGIPLDELCRFSDDKSRCAKEGVNYVFDPSVYSVFGKSEVIASAAEINDQTAVGGEAKAAAQEAAKKILFKSAMILIPAAKGYQIQTKEDVDRLSADTKIFAPAANIIFGKPKGTPAEAAKIEELVLKKGILSLPSWLTNFGGIATSKEEILHRLMEGGLNPMKPSVDAEKRRWLKSHVTGSDVIDVAWANIHWAMYLWKREAFARPIGEILKDRARRIASLRKKLLMQDTSAPATLVGKLLKLDSATILAKARVFAEDLGSDMENLEKALENKSAPLAIRRVAAYVMGKTDRREYAEDLVKVIEDDGESAVMYRNAASSLGYILEEHIKDGISGKISEIERRLKRINAKMSGKELDEDRQERKDWIGWILKKIESDKAVVTPSGSFAEEDAKMKRLHDIDTELIPPSYDGKVLYHIIPETIIPHEYVRAGIDTQRVAFSEAVKNWNRAHPELSEKIWIATAEDMKHVDKLVADIAKRERDLTKRGIVVDLALDRGSYLDDAAFMAMLPKGAEFLLFEPEGGKLGNFAQLEGILAALRALHIEDFARRVEKLKSIHELLTGRSPMQTPDPNDSAVEFARKLRFVLPPIEIRDPGEFDTLNKNLIALMAAA